MQGRLYDGLTAQLHDVEVEFGSGEIRLSQPSGWTDAIDVGELKRIDCGPGALRLCRRDVQGWRLVLPVDAGPQVDHLLGNQERYGRLIDRLGLLPALAIGAVVTAIAVTTGYSAPSWIAPHVPMRWERNVGSALVGDFGTMRCRNAAGQRALEALVERVAPGATRGPNGIKVAALDEPVFNAAALPGGYIIVFKPAITETDTDALAGIIAHEVAHVRRRHVTEALMRELGMGALIRMFAGNLGANAEQLVALSYTRQNEAQADSDAIVMLRRAKISPKPTAELFERLERESPSYSAEFLESHPLSGKRAKQFFSSFDPKAAYTAALSREQSDALFEICRK